MAGSTLVKHQSIGRTWHRVDVEPIYARGALAAVRDPQARHRLRVPTAHLARVATYSASRCSSQQGDNGNEELTLRHLEPRNFVPIRGVILLPARGVPISRYEYEYAGSSPDCSRDLYVRSS